jgi:hypothetical protein
MNQKDNDAKRREYEDMLRKKIEECVKYKVELQDKVVETQKRAGVSREVANTYERYYGTQSKFWEYESEKALKAYLDYQEACIDLECMTLKITRLGEKLAELQIDRNTNPQPENNDEQKA